MMFASYPPLVKKYQLLINRVIRNKVLNLGHIQSALVYYLVLFHTDCITLAVVIIEEFSCPAV